MNSGDIMTEYHYDYYFDKNGKEVLLRPNQAKGLKLLRRVARKYKCKCGKTHQYKSQAGKDHLDQKA